MNHIRDSLPMLIQQVNDALYRYEGTLRSYGAGAEEVTDKLGALLDLM